VFCYYKYVSGLKNYLFYSFSTTIKFGTSDLVKIEVKPICLIKTDVLTNYEYFNQKSRSFALDVALDNIDKDVSESFASLSDFFEE